MHPLDVERRLGLPAGVVRRLCAPRCARSGGSVDDLEVCNGRRRQAELSRKDRQIACRVGRVKGFDNGLQLSFGLGTSPYAQASEAAVFA